MKKVLIITYYWPPSGGPGVQRVLKFVKYLPQFGWEPIVLTVKNGEYPAIDKSLLEEIPKNVKVYKTRSFEIFSLYKKLTGQNEEIPTYVLSKSENESTLQKISKWIRANIFIPDARIGWIPSIIKEGKKIIKIEKPEIIFSSSPPHSLQIGAMKLAKKTNTKWVADFRDPWSNAFWQSEITKNKISEKIEIHYEKDVFKTANSITTVSSFLCKDFKENYRKEVKAITNGFDEDDFTNIQKRKNEKFRITYAGTLSKEQSINNFLTSVKKLDDKAKKNIEINFYGSIHQNIILEINNKNLNNIIKVRESKPHDEIISIIQNSDMLLLVIPKSKNNKGIITGKIFEYLATKNFILGIGPTNGDAAKILQETNCGKMFDFNDDLTNEITEKINAWKKEKALKINEEEVKKYSRKLLTKKLTEIFEEVL